MRLVIGYDGSECAESAIADLRHAGIPGGSEAMVLTVGDLLVETPYATTGEASQEAEALARRSSTFVTQARAAAAEVMAEARQASVRGADLVKGLFPDWTVGADAVADSPYWALVTKAGEWPADLAPPSMGAERWRVMVMSSSASTQVALVRAVSRVVVQVRQRVWSAVVGRSQRGQVWVVTGRSPGGGGSRLGLR